MSKTATALAELALSASARRERALSDRAKKARMSASAALARARELEDASLRPTQSDAVDVARHVFIAEDLVRGVVLAMRDELRGDDGKDASPEQIEATVCAEFAKIAPGLRGKDGKTVKPEAVLAMVRDVFAEHRAELKGDPGKDVDLVQVNAMVRQALTALGHETPSSDAMQAAIRAEVQMIAPQLRGADGSPGLIWKGEWQRGITYEPGDVVRYSRASYIALEQTVGVAPGSDKRRWELMVRDGEDGGGGGYVPSDSGSAANVKWTLANTDYPYFGYTHHQHKWKIEKINVDGTATVARPDNNSGIEYAAAWASRTTLNYAT